MRIDLSFLRINKRIRKFLARSILFLVFFGVITVCSCFIWLTHYSWSKIASEKEMKENGLEVFNSPNLPDNFYHIYDIVKPNNRKVTMAQQFLSSLTSSHNRYDCKCDDISYLSWNNNNLNLRLDPGQLLKSYGYWKFGFGLEKYATPQKCFDYYINNDIFFKQNYLQNLNELSKKVLDKELENLKTDEILKLIAWHDALRISRGRIEFVNQRYLVLKNVYNQKTKSISTIEK